MRILLGMARKLRIEYDGAIYHVTIRGVEKRRIFDVDADRERFLLRLGEAVEEYGVRLYLFCLMRNHVHLVIETPQGNLSAFMHKLQTAYTVYYNIRHQRSGHLMQGRFGAKPVQGDRYLLRLSRYVHLNPVFVGSVREQPLNVRRSRLRDYRWSSYPGYAGLQKSYPFIDEAPLLALTDPTPKKTRAAYRRFVERGMADTDEEFVTLLSEANWGIGDDGFQVRLRDLHTDRADQAKRPEDVSFRRTAAAVPAATVLETVAAEFGIDSASLKAKQYGSVGRAVAAFFLVRYAGMSQREAAELLGMGTGAAACQQLKRLRERQDADPSLARRIRRIQDALAGYSEAETET